MTTIDRFDDVVAAWLVEAGPADIRPAAVEHALERAARLPQRRGVQGWLVGRPLQPSRTRVALLVAVAALALAAAALVAGTLLRPSPLGGGGWINVSSSNGNSVYVLTPDGATAWSLGNTHSFCPRVSPDGTEVVVRDGRFSSVGLWAVPRASADRRLVVSGVGNYGYRDGAWAPNRAYLAFRTDEQSLNVVDVFGSAHVTNGGALANRAVYVTSSDVLYSEAAWSADSSQLAIAQGQGSQFTIEILGRDAVVQRTIGPFPMDFDPVVGTSLGWSPDGTRLAYRTATGVTVVDVASGTRRSEAGAPPPYEFMEASPWSRDGRWLALLGADGNLVLSGEEGTSHIAGPAVRFASMGYFARWSPVADIVAVGTPSGLATIAAEHGNRTDLMTVAADVPWGFAWSPDGSRIVVAVDHGASGGLRVTILDATGRSAAVPIATFPSFGESERCVSWDAPTNP